MSPRPRGDKVNFRAHAIIYGLTRSIPFRDVQGRGAFNPRYPRGVRAQAKGEDA
nr:hypothetical protein [Enterobacter hormaechei]